MMHQFHLLVLKPHTARSIDEIKGVRWVVLTSSNIRKRASEYTLEIKSCKSKSKANTAIQNKEERKKMVVQL